MIPGLMQDVPEGFRDEARGEIQSRLATALRDLDATREADGNLLNHGAPKFEGMPDISEARQRAGASRPQKREN